MVFDATQGKRIKIREAVRSDASDLIDYLNRVGGESDYLSFGLDRYDKSIAQEEEFIENSLKQDNALLIIAEANDKIIGCLNFKGETRERLQHMGEFGVTVLREYWDEGIGEELIKCLIDWCRSAGIIRKINLKVRTDNARGIYLYKRLGFIEEGIMKRHVCINGEFYDSLLMGMLVN